MHAQLIISLKDHDVALIEVSLSICVQLGMSKKNINSLIIFFAFFGEMYSQEKLGYLLLLAPRHPGKKSSAIISSVRGVRSLLTHTF